jgi:putative membrane protein
VLQGCPPRHDLLVRALIRVLVNAVALWVATLLVPGVHTTAGQSGTQQAVTFVVLGLVFGVVNLLVRPVVKLLALPLYLLTLGLFAFVVNALMLELTSWLSGHTRYALHVDRFFWSAVLGALVISVVSWLLELVVPDGRDD